MTNNRRYQVEIISDPKSKGWFKGMVGQIITVRFVRYRSNDFILYGVTEDYKYIREDHLRIVNGQEFNTVSIKDHNEPTCSHFGCRNRLSFYGNLFNDRCPDHQQRQKVDIMKVLKFK